MRKATRPKTTTSSTRKPARSRAGRVVVVARGSARAVIAFALSQVGKPYVFGASGPNAYDCSGFTAAAFARAGIRLPHQSGAQRRYGDPISRSELAPGDLVLYSGHVAIYIGGGRIVHAANPRKGVLVATMYGSPVGYRRLL